MNNGILCYDLVDSNLEPAFTFPNFKKIKPKTYTKQVNFSCLTYRESLGDYEERFNNNLSKEILVLGYNTRKEIRNKRKWHQNDIEKLKFKNFINPLSKTKKDNIERAIPFVFVGTPTIGIPASFMADSEWGLLVSIFFPLAAEVSRRLGIRETKGKIKKINKILKQPKVRILSDLIERKSEINVEPVFVESAGKYMEKIRDPDVISYVDFNKVNQRLIQEYQDFVTQPKI